MKGLQAARNATRNATRRRSRIYRINHARVYEMVKKLLMDSYPSLFADGCMSVGAASIDDATGTVTVDIICKRVDRDPYVKVTAVVTSLRVEN